MTIENLQKQVEELNEKISTLPETEENKVIIDGYKNRIELIEKQIALIKNRNLAMEESERLRREAEEKIEQARIDEKDAIEYSKDIRIIQRQIKLNERSTRKASKKAKVCRIRRERKERIKRIINKIKEPFTILSLKTQSIIIDASGKICDIKNKVIRKRNNVNKKIITSIEKVKSTLKRNIERIKNIFRKKEVITLQPKYKIVKLNAKGKRPLRTKKTPVVNTKKSKVGTFLKKGLQKIKNFVGTIGLRTKIAATDIGIKVQNTNRKIIITRNKINQKIVTTIDTARSKVGNFKKNVVDRFKKAAQKIKNAFSVNEEEKQKLIARLEEKKGILNAKREENKNLYEQGKFKNLYEQGKFENLTRTRTRSGYVSTTILAILAVSIVGLLVAYWTLLMVK